MPFALFSMLGGPGETGCDEVRFQFQGGWDSRYVSVTDICDCVKKCMSFVM